VPILTSTPIPPSATVTPTSIPESPTATGTPAESLSAQGPWLLYVHNSPHLGYADVGEVPAKFIILNQDGSGRTSITLPECGDGKVTSFPPRRTKFSQLHSAVWEWVISISTFRNNWNTLL
jgi:hypothetical protein